MNEEKRSDLDMFTHILIMYLHDDVLHTIRRAISDEYITGWCPVCLHTQGAFKDGKIATEQEIEDGEGITWQEDHEKWCPASQIDAYFAEQEAQS